MNLSCFYLVQHFVKFEKSQIATVFFNVEVK